jgi:hypothetical protein
MRHVTAHIAARHAEGILRAVREESLLIETVRPWCQQRKAAEDRPRFNASIEA